MFFLRLLPNKMLSPAERRLRSQGYGVHTDLLNLYHSALRVILSELIEIQQKDRENGAGMQFFVHDKGSVHLHFELSFIIGDTAGHDALCCHYK